MGPKETKRFFREGGTDALKNVYEGEPWEAAPLIVKVANPGDYGKICRFVVVWDNKSQDHKTCPFYHHIMSKETVEIDCDRPTRLELKESQQEEATDFVPWEERESKECDYSLVKELFVKRRTESKKEKPKKKTPPKKKEKKSKPTKTDRNHKKNNKNKKKRKKSGKTTKQDFSCKEDVSEKILRLLRASFKFRKSTGAGKKTTSKAAMPTYQAPRGREVGSIPGFLKDATERLRLRKSVKTKRSVKRKREAPIVVGKVMDTLLRKVMRRVYAQDQLKESNTVVGNLLDKVLMVGESSNPQPRSQGDDVLPTR